VTENRGDSSSSNDDLDTEDDGCCQREDIAEDTYDQIQDEEKEEMKTGEVVIENPRLKGY